MMTFDASRQWLEIPDTVQTEAWQRSQSIAPAGLRLQAYLNQVCLDTVLRWMQEHDPTAQAWAGEQHCPALWRWVNGSAIALNQQRIVLVPSEAIDRGELRVPQEWVDIATWVGDYFLAVEVDVDEQWVEVWGFTTQADLKRNGQLDPIDRTYCISADDLVHDMTVFWVAQQLNPEPTPVAMPALAELPSAEARSLLQQLHTSSTLLPHLNLPFAQWGALLQHDPWLQQLCQPAATPTASATTALAANLSQWLQNVVEAGWQTLDELLGAEPELAFNLRQDEPSTAAVRRVKRLSLGADYPALLLLLLLTPDADQRIGVRVRLMPSPETEFLPADLHLSLLSAEGEVVQSVQSRQQDNYIQLKRFKCRQGMRFRVQVAIAQTLLTEDFVT